MTDERFDVRRDPALGDRIRAHLEPGDAAAFTARVLRHLPRRGNSWDVLADWARPGIAAALVIAAAAGYWLVLGDRTGAAPSAAEVLATDQPLDSDALMGVVLGAGR